MVSGAWAELETTTIDGKEYYKIAYAEDLEEFATMVNGGQTTINAVLTKDIDMSELDSWTAIGDWNTGNSESGYNGHFDGQGHTISNFSFFATNTYFGLFGVIQAGCLIENFTIEGKITVDGNYGYAGSVAAYGKEKTITIRNVQSAVDINSTSTAGTPRIGGILGAVAAQNTDAVIDRCTYSGTLNANDKGGNYGGIVGYIFNNANVSAAITNCLFSGKLQSSIGTNSAQLGGLIGYTRKGIVSVENCLSLGEFEFESGNDMNIGQFIGRLTFDNKTSGCTFADNYYQDKDYELYGTSSGGAPKGSEPVKVTDEDLASGKIAYQLNKNVSGGENWYQTLGETPEAYPKPYGSNKVYANGSYYCDGVTPKGTITYGNAEASTVDPHTPANGICSFCGKLLDENYMTPNGEDIYEIGTPAQLKWFAAYVNQVDPTVNAVLTADIDLDGVAWTPMCGGSGNVAPGATAYTGTFDGQGYSITGFNAEGVGHLGLFGDANNATIKNFSISGSLKVTGGYCGGVVANLTNCNIENVHSALIIDVPNASTHHVGGVVGTARGGNIIKGCSFDGSMTVASGSTDNSAGIAAYITNGDKVIDCVNYGNVTFKDINCAAGGIVGYVNAQEAYVQNCLTIGKILFDGDGAPKYGGAILGRTKGFSAEKVTNNYWLEGSAYGSVKNNDGSVSEVALSVTTEQLASGEVAAKLAPAFRQKLGTDAYPTLDATKPLIAQITAAGYATLFVPETSLEIPTGVTAYTGTIEGDQLWLHPLENVITNGQAVVLKGNAGFYGFAPTDAGFGLVKSDLVAEEEDITADGTQYVLAKVDDKVGFYQAKADTKIAARKAYLKVPANTEVKGFTFAEESETAIENVNVNGNGNNGAIFNIAGQKLSKLQKGINIVNGKKVLK